VRWSQPVDATPGGQLAINTDDGLPNARPIAFGDSPRNQLSHNTIFSAAPMPLRSHWPIVLHSLSFPSTIKCCVDRLSWLGNSGQSWILAGVGLSANDP